MADDKTWKPGMPVPQDEDGKSATRSPKKGEKPVYEEPGSGIVVKKAKGGSVSARADGCCTKGKTRGKMV